MGILDDRDVEPADPAEKELVRRVTQALDARAMMKGVDAEELEQRLAQVHASAGDGVVSVDVDITGMAFDGTSDARQRRSRQVAAAVVSAAAAVLIAVACVGVARWNGGASAPAAPSAPSHSSPPPSPVDEQERWVNYPGLYHQQWATELDGVAALGDDVVPGSVRVLAQLDQYWYWAGFTQDGRLCWRVAGPGTDAAGCSLQPSASEPVEVSDGSTAPQLWLVPIGTPTAVTDPLTADGLIEWTPGVWVDAGALKPPLSLFERFREAPTAADVIPADSAIVVRDPLVPGSIRLLQQGERGSFYVAYEALGKMCLFWAAPSGGQSASTCQTPQYLAGEGFSGVDEAEDSNGTAWVAPDDLDTSSWPALGRVQLSKNLWFQTVPRGDPAPPTPAAQSPTPAGEQGRPTIINDWAGSPAPDLLGFSGAEAAEALEQRGMSLGEVTVQDAGSAPSGIVVATSPPAGAPVADGTAVDLFLAR